MEQIAQVDQKVEKIISRLFENPSQNNPVFSREFNGRIQGGLKFPKQIKTSNEGLKKTKLCDFNRRNNFWAG